MTTRVGRPGSVRPARSAVPAPRRPAGPGPAPLREVLRRLAGEGFPDAGAVVLGGGCAGLALGVAVAERGGAVAVVDAAAGGRDGRTWCYWDTGDALLPEAVSRSWQRWEVRTPTGAVVAADPDHPYRMVRAQDYRAAARARLLAAGGRLVDGTRVVAGAPDRGSPGPRVVDARGALPPAPVPAGRVLLQQRFVGQWVRTARPVFDDSTVTLMDFPADQGGDGVRFFYVLPVAPDLALVECTVFTPRARGTAPLRGLIAAYVRDRWALEPHEWTVEGQEAGAVPMTDARPERGGRDRIGLRAGAARPSTGYAFTRIQVAAARATAALERGEAVPAQRDALRVRALDAVFLRFLRDRPELAPAVFLRLFAALPGPLTVRFLTERSSPLDDLRLVLALPKAPFLRAAAVTAAERLRAGRR